MSGRDGHSPVNRPTVLRPLVASNLPLFRSRLRWTYLVLIALLLALVARLAFIQIADGAYYSKLSVEQVRTNISLPPLRGAIFDRSGNVLAISSPTSLVVADDFQIKHPLAESEALAPFLHASASVLNQQLSRRSGYVVLDPNLSIALGHQLAQQDFPGVAVLSSSVRTEPNGTIGTALLGGVNSAGAGSAGVEYQYQSVLAGKTGLESVFASPSGVNLPGTHVTTIRKAVAGVGLELTIDTPLQFVTEQALGEQMHATGGLSGTAIVMDVKTGQILADASLVNTQVPAGVLGPIPSWGKNIGVTGINQTINDLAFSQVYEPGSVFKIVPFSAALDAGAITPQSRFSVPYSVIVGGRRFHDADFHGDEDLTATEILAQSSNIGTYEITRHVGEAGLLAQVQRLGFGETTDINFPGESPGLLVNATQWYGSDLAAMPIGQVDAVTPIQVLDAYNAIANGGLFVEPKLVRAFVNANGSLTATPASTTRRALSPTVASELNTMLQQVVLDGTGVEAVIPGYRVAGKTGTSQIPTPGQQSYITGAYDASFVGFAPADNPVLSMIVLIQRPQTVIFGGSVAAPVFQRVMSYALHHYGIAATGPTAPPAHHGTSVSSDVT